MGTWAEVEVLDDGVQDLLVADGAGAAGVCTGGFRGVEGVGCVGTWAEVGVLDDGVQDLLVADGAGAAGVYRGFWGG